MTKIEESVSRGGEFPTEPPSDKINFEDRTFSLGEMMVYLLVVAAAGAVAIYWFMSKPVEAYSVNNVPTAWSALSVQCKGNGGNWSVVHRECENISPEWCDDRGGHFFSCESACRHEQVKDGFPTICTMQCVPVCRLKVSVSTLGPGPMNTSYIIEGKKFDLRRGRFEKIDRFNSGSSVKIWIFEALTSGDLDGDDDEDTVVILVKENGDNKTLYYAAIAVQDNGEFFGTNAILIGNQIAPQNNSITDGLAVVNYADRYPWESIGTRPSVGKSKRLRLNGADLVEVSGVRLSTDVATDIAVEKWGGCDDDRCDDLKVRVLDGNGGVWYVEATYRGLRDDSVRAIRRAASVHFVEDEWIVGSEYLTQYLCQPGRGQQEFADEICI